MNFVIRKEDFVLQAMVGKQNLTVSVFYFIKSDVRCIRAPFQFSEFILTCLTRKLMNQAKLICAR
jgi:hypothetical protein